MYKLTIKLTCKYFHGRPSLALPLARPQKQRGNLCLDVFFSHGTAKELLFIKQSHDRPI